MISTPLNVSVSGIHKSIEKYNNILKGGLDTDLLKDTIELLEASNELKANIKSLKTADEMLGTIIDVMA